MNKTGPIIIIEDDPDDQFILQTVFQEFNYLNKVVFFENGFDALKFLENPAVKPFLVISDINMPSMNGLELREKIFHDQQLKTKCIPYLFFTTGATSNFITEAYALSVQGFFRKPHSLEEFKSVLKRIIEYWQICLSPGE